MRDIDIILKNLNFIVWAARNYFQLVCRAGACLTYAFVRHFGSSVETARNRQLNRLNLVFLELSPSFSLQLKTPISELRIVVKVQRMFLSLKQTHWLMRLQQ